MPLCGLCHKKFPIKAVVDGKVRNLSSRKYCLDCSPFGSGNTRKLERPPAEKTKNEKYRKWQQKARKERKEKLIALAGGKCVVCGYCKCSKALEFHHKSLDEKHEKSFGISSKGMLSRWDHLLREIQKCVLVCCRCHREIHDGICEVPLS